jgi:hypothetical protein
MPSMPGPKATPPPVGAFPGDESESPSLSLPVLPNSCAAADWPVASVELVLFVVLAVT